MIAKNVFITRSNSQSAVDTMKKVVKTLVKDKTSLYIYPEGTRSHTKSNTMLPRCIIVGQHYPAELNRTHNK